MNGSPKLQLNKNDILSVLRGAILAIGGALITYLAIEVVPNIDESTTLGALVAGTAATTLNLLRKYLMDSR